jgi:Putative heavy-metal chelation
VSSSQNDLVAPWKGTVDALGRAVLDGAVGPDPKAMTASISFMTLQRSRHTGRSSAYANRLISLRVGRSVGTCYVEDGQIGQDVIDACVGQPLADLLRHPELPVRIAALDAYLTEVFPHELQRHARPVAIPAGTSIAKSRCRARAVIGLLAPVAGARVALIGVVNSLIEALQERGAVCLPCDYNVGETEWGQPVTSEMEEVLAAPDAILATGMTLANGTFDAIADRAAGLGVPLVVFAQTGSGIVPQLVGGRVTGVSAEPYPFFWQSGGETLTYHYLVGGDR